MTFNSGLSVLSVLMMLGWEKEVVVIDNWEKSEQKFHLDIES